MKYKMTTIVTKQEAKTYRFKFSKGFIENLKEFTLNQPQPPWNQHLVEVLHSSTPAHPGTKIC